MHSAPKPPALSSLRMYVGNQFCKKRISILCTASLQFVYILLQIIKIGNKIMRREHLSHRVYVRIPRNLHRFGSVVIAPTLLRTTDQAAAFCSLQSAVSREHELQRITDNTMTTPGAGRICHFREGETAVGHIHSLTTVRTYAALWGRLRSCYIPFTGAIITQPQCSSISGPGAPYE